MAGFEVLRQVATHNAEAMEEAFDEMADSLDGELARQLHRPQQAGLREGIPVQLWRNLRQG